MPKQLLHTTNLLECHLEAHNGVEVISRYNLLSQLISSEIDNDTSLILAEPIKNVEHDRVRWFTSLAGPVVPWENLIGEARQRVTWQLDQTLGALSKLATDLSDSTSSNSVLAGELLSHLLSHSNNYQIFLVGDRPVIVGWGLSAVNQGQKEAMNSLSHILTEKSVSEAPAVAPPVSPGVQGEGSQIAAPFQGSPAYPTPPPQFHNTYTYVKPAGNLNWLKALLGIILALGVAGVLAYFLLPGLAQGLGGLFGRLPSFNMPVVDFPQFDANSDQEKALRAQLQALKDDYALKLSACTPDSPAPEVPEDDNLEIPEEASEENDFSFIEGCWYSGSDELNNLRTNLPIIFKYCFDENGQAEVTIDEKDEKGNHIETCTTSAKASFEDGSLVITEDKGPYCPNTDTSYYSGRVVCKPGKDKQADCILLQESDIEPLSVTFTRAKP